MNHKLAIGYGIINWAIGFLVSILIFPLHANERPLFESIMPVVMTAVTVYMTLRYMQKSKKKTIGVGFCLGLVWLAANVILDLLLFMQGPMKMTLSNYIKDIGVTYLMIPIITTAMYRAAKS